MCIHKNVLSSVTLEPLRGFFVREEEGEIGGIIYHLGYCSFRGVNESRGGFGEQSTAQHSTAHHKEKIPVSSACDCGLRFAIWVVYNYYNRLLYKFDVLNTVFFFFFLFFLAFFYFFRKFITRGE